MSGDGDEAPPQQAIPPAVPPREHLITTAIKFLNNPNVLRSAVGQKQAFLRSKGLTEDEIQLACERAGVFSREPIQQNHQTVISMDVGTGGGGGGVAKASYSDQGTAAQPEAVRLAQPAHRAALDPRLAAAVPVPAGGTDAQQRGRAGQNRRQRHRVRVRVERERRRVEKQRQQFGDYIINERALN